MFFTQFKMVVFFYLMYDLEQRYRCTCYTANQVFQSHSSFCFVFSHLEPKEAKMYMPNYSRAHYINVCDNCLTV